MKRTALDFASTFFGLISNNDAPMCGERTASLSSSNVNNLRSSNKQISGDVGKYETCTCTRGSVCYAAR